MGASSKALRKRASASTMADSECRNRPPTHATVSPTSTQQGTTNSAELNPVARPDRVDLEHGQRIGQRQEGSEADAGPARVAEPHPHEHDQEEGAVQEGVIAGEAVVQGDHAHRHRHEPQGGRSPVPGPRDPVHHGADGNTANPTATIPGREKPTRKVSTAPATVTSTPVPIHKMADSRPTRWVVRVPWPTSSTCVPSIPTPSAPGTSRLRPGPASWASVGNPGHASVASTSAAARWPEDTAPSM